MQVSLLVWSPIWSHMGPSKSPCSVRITNVETALEDMTVNEPAVKDALRGAERGQAVCVVRCKVRACGEGVR
eukprot:932924-Prymnesium_polylepis.1